MLERTFVRTGVIARLRRSPLGPYLDTLATALHHEGYAPSSIQRFLCAAEQFAQFIAVCSASILAVELRTGSLFSS